MNQVHRFFGVIALFGLASCAQTKSENVDTADLLATFELSRDDSNSSSIATCTASFQIASKNGVVIELTDGDSVTCNGMPMASDPNKGKEFYFNRFPIEADQNVEIVFTRAKERLVATVSLPDKLETTMQRGLRPRKGQTLEVDWVATATPDSTMYAILSFFDPVKDRFGQVKPMKTVIKTSPSPERGQISFLQTDTTMNNGFSGNWKGNLELRRSRRGTIPSPLQGSFLGNRRIVYPLTLVD